ncbi:MAG TPA: GH25 family lysozyme [Lacipirellulaceae bacterium]|nr:GH25 family lysozyme [Lacipirellulaceae bacterium]
MRSFVGRLLVCCASVLILQAPKAWAARAAGIDVSHYQGTITAANWVSVANSGISFAWSKADEGNVDAYNDSTFINNMNRGTAAGIYMGAYHYARPDLNSDANVDAAHFVDIAGPYLTTGHLRPMLDIEAESFGLSTSALSSWINTFCTYVTGHYGASADPLIYISASPAGSKVNTTVTGHGLDVASYGTNPVNPAIPTGNPGTGVWPTWNFWQYGSQGRIPGIGGGTANVDVDVANGDTNYLQAYVIGGTTPPTLFQQFDVNGTTGGSGVTANGSYTWEAAKYSSTSAGTDPIAWNEGNFLRLAAGTDAATSSYTVTANSNHTVAGMMLQDGGGGTVTINGPGVLSIADGDQGFYVTNSTQNLKINASLGGNGRLVWQGSGSLYLLGNNTYTGGTLLNSGAGLNFSNNNSFGTGRITWGVTQVVLADDAATSAVTLANPVTTIAGGQLIYVGPAAAPVTFSGAWTLISGTNTLTVGNTSHASSKMTISGKIGGSGGALVKNGVGTLVITGANTYTGGTTLNVGALTVSGASAKLGTGNVTVQSTTSTITSLSIESGVQNAIADTATLTLAGGGTAGVADQSYATLGDGVNELVSALILGGVSQAHGTYGSSASGAMHQLNEFFSGNGMIAVGLSAMPGDFNNDYVVDAHDYDVWRSSVGEAAGTLQNDNSGAEVGTVQYVAWRSNFGAAASGAGSSLANQAAVPEPSTLLLLIPVGAAVNLRRRQKRD